MEKIAKNNAPANRPFCGLSALIERLEKLSAASDSWHVDDEIREIISELRLLDGTLSRLRHERAYVDERDIDLAIDRLRRLEQRGA